MIQYVVIVNKGTVGLGTWLSITKQAHSRRRFY